VVPGVGFARVTPDGTNIWFFSATGGSAEVYDVSSDELIGSVKLNGPAADAVFSPDGSICYVAYGSSTGIGGVLFIDVETLTKAASVEIGENPASLALTKDGTRLWVANTGENSVSIIDTKRAEVVRSIFAGVEPVSLALAFDDDLLFVANRGVDRGASGGSNVTVISTESERIVRVLESSAGACFVSATRAGDRLAVLHSGGGATDSLWIYAISMDGSNLVAELVGGADTGPNVLSGTIDPSGKLLTVVSQGGGLISMIDIYEPGSISVFSEDDDRRSQSVTFASIDLDAEIARCDAIIESESSHADVQRAHFKKAYLQASMGDVNSVVETYSKIVDDYAGTSSEAKALFKLGDLCYDSRLLANAADYYNRGLAAYANLLSSDQDAITYKPEGLLDAADRLVELSDKIDADYFVTLYRLYSAVPVMLPELPKLFFTFGIALQKQGNSKFAKKCFTETEDGIIELLDESMLQEMRARLALVRGDNRAVLKARNIKSTITLDGRMNEWSKAEVLEIDTRAQVIVNPQRWMDESDISGTFSVCYDQFNIYVAGRVLDDKIYRADMSAADYVGIYLDVRDGSGKYETRHKTIDDGVVVVRVYPPVDENSPFEVSTNGQVQPLVGGAIVEGGYNFELKIPIAYLQGFVPEKKRRIGFGIELFDIDSGSESDPPKVTGWMMPTQSAYGKRLPEMFGILSF
jgi:YVTN family beta-propeller protein